MALIVARNALLGSVYLFYLRLRPLVCMAVTVAVRVLPACLEWRDVRSTEKAARARDVG